MRSFNHYYWNAFLRPAEVYKRLLTDNRKLRYALYAILINMVAYTLVYVFLIYGDGRPYKPWLDIPEELYYRYNVWFTAPSMLVGWLAAAGLVHLISRSFTWVGTFDDLLILLGFSISIASWSTSVHDVVSSGLGALHIIDQQQYELLLNTPTIWRTILWVLFGLYFLWFMLLFSISVYLVYKPRKIVALLLGIAGFGVYQLFFLIFNR